MPSPQKSISEDIQKKSDESNIDLRSFLTTTEEDPFEGMDTQEASPSKEHETVDIEDKDLPF
jgi:hypothetical protein